MGQPRAYRYRMSGQAILLMGNDTFRIGERTKAVIDGLLPADQRVVGLETIDGRENGTAFQALSSVLQALRSVSLFGGNRVVWLKDATFLSERSGEEDGAGDAEKTAPVKRSLSELAALIKGGMPDGVTFLLTAPGVDKRSALFRAFDSAGSVETLEVSEKAWEAEKQVRGFLDEHIGKHRIRMSDDAKQALLRRTGADTQAVANEVAKLALYCGKDAVAVEDVVSVAVSSREAIVWDLTDAIGARNVAGAFDILRQLLFQGESPMAVIVVIEGYFRQLAVARDILDRKWAVLGGRELEWQRLGESETAYLDALGKLDLRKGHPFRAFKVAQQASRRTARDIRRCRRAILAAHERLVSSSLPQSLTLDFLLRDLLA